MPHTTISFIFTSNLAISVLSFLKYQAWIEKIFLQWHLSAQTSDKLATSQNPCGSCIKLKLRLWITSRNGGWKRNK